MRTATAHFSDQSPLRTLSRRTSGLPRYGRCTKDMSGPVPARPDIQSAPVPPRGPRRWRWIVIGSIIGIGSVVWIAGFIAYATHDHPGGFIGDRGFIDAANAACRKARASLPPPAAPDATQEERARVVEAVHTWMSALVNELAVIPVRGGDRDEVRCGSLVGGSSSPSGRSMPKRSGPATRRSTSPSATWAINPHATSTRSRQTTGLTLACCDGKGDHQAR